MRIKNGILDKNILYKYQFEVLVVMSFPLPLHYFTFPFKTE